jgi:predicted N-acyltransferase
LSHKFILKQSDRSTICLFTLFSKGTNKSLLMKSLLATLERNCPFNTHFQLCIDQEADSRYSQVDERELIPLVGDLSVQYFRSAFDLPAQWDELVKPEQFFLSRSYLCTFEQYKPAKLGFAYLTVYKNKELVGLMSFQLITFRTIDQLRDLKVLEEEKGWSKIRKQLIRSLLSGMNFNLIIAGATQFTGEYGIALKSDADHNESSVDIMDNAIQLLAKLLRQENWKAHAVLIKDFHQPLPIEDKGYHAFPFMPNMTMDISEHWHSFDDYLASMLSKYRVRAKRAFKKAKEISLKEFELEDIIAYEKEMYDLYRQVESNADFSMITLSGDYFQGLKEELEDKFRVFAYFKEERLVGFFTTIRNGRELEAHFLGFDNEDNYRYQLYLNMLYHIIEVAIEEGANKVVFARTASGIKSSVGAVPHQMYCYIRHFSPLVNRLLPKIVGFFEPKEEWIQRHPFGK